MEDIYIVWTKYPKLIGFFTTIPPKFLKLTSGSMGLGFRVMTDPVLGYTALDFAGNVDNRRSHQATCSY